MAFLDNSGDIILDAVLTDTGRMRLARGDGSFRVTKFALGDDEINYSLYDKNNPSGSAYYATTIMQTPIFEAFTNNIASLNSRLVTYSRNDLLYLPVLKPNYKVKGSEFAISALVLNGYAVVVDADTDNYVNANGPVAYTSTAVGTDGIMNGFNPTKGSTIRVDQGIDNTNVPASLALNPDLVETQYLIEIDNRFGSIVDKNGANALTPSFIDDDYVAAYYISAGTNTQYVRPNAEKSTTAGTEVIAGSRGNILEFKIQSALDVSTSDYLFNQLGTSEAANYTGETTYQGNNVRHILGSVRITGLTTGAFIEIPLLLIKKIS